MSNKVYYEDVTVGSEIPPLVKHPSSRQLVMWACASGDYNEIHYDKDFAVSYGQPDIIVHGPLSASFMAQLITDWIGDEGTFKKMTTQNRQVVLPRQDLTCRGVVTKKYVENDEHCVACDIWLENAKGDKCVLGTALVALQTRGTV